MKLIGRIATEAWAVIRYLATGRTRSRRDRHALASYQRYAAASRDGEGG